MRDTFFENLFYKQEKQFEKINDLSNQDFKKYFDSLDQKQNEEFLNKLTESIINRLKKK